MASSRFLRRQISGVEAVSAALRDGKGISLVLIVSEGASDGALRLAALARERGVAVRAESARELRRMSAGDSVVEVLALEGPAPQQGLETLMSSEGIVFLLAGLRYPGNVGFILRSLEVAGALSASGLCLSIDSRSIGNFQ